MKQRILFLLLFLSVGVIQAEDTVLTLYRPYSEAEESEVGRIKMSVRGSCLRQATLITREDAWVCEAEGKKYEPCFIKMGPNRTQALCPQSPWDTESIERLLSKPVNNENNQLLDMSTGYPWGIELGDGTRCLAIRSTRLIEQLPVHYRCPDKKYLIGSIQRCKSQWSMLQSSTQGTDTVLIKRVWF